MITSRTLAVSHKLLTEITATTHNTAILPIAQRIWDVQLRPENPLWKHLAVKRFAIDTDSEKAHVLAMIDERLPSFGLVGFFGCTSVKAGADVLAQATAWLKDQGLHDVYGPINGTITRDYRLNLEDDYKVPGEPVNPSWYIDAFKQAGFLPYNHYVSGYAKYYKLLMKLLAIGAPKLQQGTVTLRPADTKHPLRDLRIYHDLMNAIFPHNSIYCPVISWEERLYNIGDPAAFFHDKYAFFLEDDEKPIGFIIAYPWEGSLVVKTIGLLPEYRGKGLFNLLIKKVHEQAASDGLAAAIYATIRTSAAVYRKRRPGVRTYRRYMTMHKSI